MEWKQQQQSVVVEEPGEFIDRSTGHLYNLNDDYQTRLEDEKKGDNHQALRRRLGISDSAPYTMGVNEAVGLEFNEETGRNQYVPVTMASIDTMIEEEMNRVHLTSYTDQESEESKLNKDRLKSQEDDDFAICPGASNYWYDQWELMVQHYKKKAEEEEEMNTMREREVISTDELRDINCNLGDTTLANIHKTLESFGNYKRAPHQALFHKKSIITCLPHIYKGEWEWNKGRVLKQHSISKINHEVFIIAPRRFGKTIAIAMLVAALLLCCIGIRIIVLATCKRASLSLARLTKKFVELSRLHNGAKRILTFSQEELFIGPPDCVADAKGKRPHVDEDQISRLHSFPGNSKSIVFRKNTHTKTSPSPPPSFSTNHMMDELDYMFQYLLIVYERMMMMMMMIICILSAFFVYRKKKLR